jgi:hypothetical protein
LHSSTDHDITFDTDINNEASGSTVTSPVIIVVDPSRVLAFHRSPPLTLAGRMDCINLYIQYHQPRPDGHIPRPMNSFLCFRKFCRTTFDLLDHESAVHVSKIAGAAWAALGQEEREYWDKVAEEVKRAHQLQYPGYRFRPQAKTPKKVATKKGAIGTSTAGKPAASKPRPTPKGKGKAATPATTLYSQGGLIGLGQRSLPTPEPSPVGTHCVLNPPPLPSSIDNTTRGRSSLSSYSVSTATSTSFSTSVVVDSTSSHVTESAPAPPAIRVQIPTQPHRHTHAQAQAQAQALHEGTILTPMSMVETGIGAGHIDAHAFVDFPSFGVDESVRLASYLFSRA